jgi:hypothetical protein
VKPILCWLIIAVSESLYQDNRSRQALEALETNRTNSTVLEMEKKIPTKEIVVA